MLLFLQATHVLVDAPLLLFQMVFLHYLISVMDFHFLLHDTSILYTNGSMSSNLDANRSIPLQNAIVSFVDDLLNPFCL